MASYEGCVYLDVLLVFDDVVMEQKRLVTELCEFLI
jgi:hypothetical protein